MAGIPPFDANQRIPNDPFYNPNANRYNLSYPTGQLIFDDNFFVDYTTGRVYISPDPPNNGTVKSIVAGTGLITSPVNGITTTGSIGLKTISTLTPGSYTYSTVVVNAFGKATLAADGAPPVTTLTGTLPIFITGNNPSINVGIKPSTTSVPGAVQLSDNLYSTDNKKALTSLQGFNLGTQMSFVGNALADQVLAGKIDPVTGFVTYVTPDGAVPTPPFVVGSVLPSASSAYDGFYFYTTGTATYTPPGGTATACVPNDKVICIDGAWVVIPSGVRLVPASTTVWGTTTLATSAEVQALTEPNKVVTPGSLASMVASGTQVGFVELATDAETQGFTDNTRAITPASLGSIQATTSTRGLVSLSNSTDNPSLTQAPTANALKTYNDSSLGTANFTAKGDLVVGLNYQTPVTLPVGSTRSQLTVDTTKPAQGSLDWTVGQSLVSWPVGAVIWYANILAPTALWLECDGRLLSADSTDQYYELFTLIGTTYNKPGDPPGFFRIPDLRGVFVRGYSSGGPNPTPTALDPGRTFASLQTSAYKQHFHTVTDPGHCHQMPLTQHAHPTNSTTVQHNHTTGGVHNHGLPPIANSEVVGDAGGFYDGNAGVSGAPSGPPSSPSTTGISINPASTGLALNTSTTGLTVDVQVTGLTVDNSPPSPPYPDESRPYNIALLPMIKFRSP